MSNNIVHGIVANAPNRENQRWLKGKQWYD